MKIKVTATLLLAATAPLMCAGCSHQEASAPAAPSASGASSPTSAGAAPSIQASQGKANAAQALTNPNTPPEAKAYIREHQGQIK